MSVKDAEVLLKWGAIAGGVLLAAYLVYKAQQLGKTPAEMLSQLGELGDSTQDPSASTFASWYDPTQRVVFFYWLTFPDGNHHLVFNSDVATDGTFTYDSANYRIGVDKSGGLRAYSV